MSVIDFKEIPEAHHPTGDQDSFELFTRDFLEALGFRIVEGPGRGIDRGRDLLISETIGGTISKQEKIWVVSAKHKAHSGVSVRDDDEPDPVGRVRKFEAQGFMGFYSTLPSSGLDDTFSRIKSQIDVYCFDRGRIEQVLVENPALLTVFQRYFPASYKKWTNVGSEIPQEEIVNTARPEEGVIALASQEVIAKYVLADEEEEGFLDLIEDAEQAFTNVTESMEHMAEAINEFGAKLMSRTTELNEAQTPQGRLNTGLAKRIVNNLAEDMEQFANRMSIEIPIFKISYGKAIDAVTLATRLLPKFGTVDKANVEGVLQMVRGLNSNLQIPRDSAMSFRSLVVALPPVTTQFKSARENTVKVLDSLVSEVATAIDQTSKAEVVLEQFARELPLMENEDQTGNNIAEA